MQLCHFSFRYCILTINYGFFLGNLFATRIIFPVDFHDHEMNEEWQRRWWVCGWGVWEDFMQARMRPTLYLPTYQSDRLLPGSLTSLCVCDVLCQPTKCKTRYPIGKWNALGEWCQMTSAGKCTHYPNFLSLGAKAFGLWIPPRRSNFLYSNGRYFAEMLSQIYFQVKDIFSTFNQICHKIFSKNLTIVC